MRLSHFLGASLVLILLGIQGCASNDFSATSKVAAKLDNGSGNANGLDQTNPLEALSGRYILSYFSSCATGAPEQSAFGRISLEINTNGEIFGRSNCNRYGSRLKASPLPVEVPGLIRYATSVSPLYQTQMACENPALNNEDAAYLHILGNAEKMIVSNGQELLVSAPGCKIMILKKINSPN